MILRLVVIFLVWRWIGCYWDAMASHKELLRVKVGASAFSAMRAPRFLRQFSAAAAPMPNASLQSERIKDFKIYRYVV